MNPTQINTPNHAVYLAAQDRQAQLTKPAGSLGQLENIAIQLAACLNTENPTIEKPWISVFAADHGIAAYGVSAFPQEVTQQMVFNFLSGGAAVSVLAKELNCEFEVVDVGCLQPIPEQSGVKSFHVGNGTAPFHLEAAMTSQQFLDAWKVGERAALDAKNASCDLFIAGEMGIGNTTSATAIICHYCEVSPAEWVGMGTGISEDTKPFKAQMIEQALTLHQENLISPEQVLQSIGGFEIVAMTASYLKAGELGLPIVVDGLISSAAALVAVKINAGVREWMLFGHQSQEPAHQIVLQSLAAEPILNLQMRLGEASGAVMAIPTIQLACALHNNMATFAEAAVSNKE